MYCSLLLIINLILFVDGQNGYGKRKFYRTFTYNQNDRQINTHEIWKLMQRIPEQPREEVITGSSRSDIFNNLEGLSKDTFTPDQIQDEGIGLQENTFNNLEGSFDDSYMWHLMNGETIQRNFNNRRRHFSRPKTRRRPKGKKFKNMFNLNKFKKPKATPKLPPRKIIPAKKKKPNTIVPPKTIPVVPSPHIADQHPQDNSINPALNDTQKTYINNCTTPGVNKPPITTTAPNNHESEIDNSEEPSTIERIDGEHTSTYDPLTTQRITTHETLVLTTATSELTTITTTLRPTTTTPELTTITTTTPELITITTTLRPTTTTPELTTIATTTPELTTTTTTTPEPSTTREATQTITNPPVFDSIEATLNYTYFTDHNKYRVKHGVEPLQYNVSLEAQAQEYSKELASMKKLQHSHYPHQGENIGMASTSIATNIVSNMYDEIKMYDFDNPGFSLETGHFTQLIWKHSKNMGTGITCEDNVCWVCFRYLPSGNILGKFDVNVLRADV